MKRHNVSLWAHTLGVVLAGSVAADSVVHPVSGLPGALVSRENQGYVSMPQTLAYVYEHHQEMLKARAEMRAADEAVNQARAGWRPTIKATGSHAVQRDSYSQLLSQRDGITPTTSGGVSVQQRLLDLGATNSGIDYAEAERGAKRAEYQSKAQEILLRAAQAHIEMIRDRHNLETARDRRAGMARIRDKSTTEYKVGIANRASVALAESNLEGAMARIAAAEGQLEKSRAAFLYAVGYLPGDLSFPASLAHLIPKDLKALEHIALTQNPAIVAAEKRLIAARAAIKNTRGGIQPTIDATGQANRSLTGRDLGRYGHNSSSVQVSLTIPLYNPPSYSQIRQSQESALAARMALELARLQVTQGVASAWASMVSARSEIRQLEAQIKATEETLRGNREERELGTMSVFEVLNTEQQLYDQQQQLNNARSSLALSEYQLLALMGRLSPEELGLSVSIYNPDENYDNVQTAWFGTKDEDAMGIHIEDPLPEPQKKTAELESQTIEEETSDAAPTTPQPESDVVDNTSATPALDTTDNAPSVEAPMAQLQTAPVPVPPAPAPGDVPVSEGHKDSQKVAVLMNPFMKQSDLTVYKPS